MLARSLGIALIALAGCADPKPERPRLAGSDGAAAKSATASVSAAEPAPSASVSASASAVPDASYPDDTIPAPSASASPSPSARVDQAVLQEVLMDYARHAGSLRSRPSQDGMLLSRLRPESALARNGLKEGDVLKDINGFKLVEPDEAVDAYAKLRHAKRFDIHIVRDGKPMTIVLEAK